MHARIRIELVPHVLLQHVIPVMCDTYIRGMRIHSTVESCTTSTTQTNVVICLPVALVVQVVGILGVRA